MRSKRNTRTVYKLLSESYNRKPKKNLTIEGFERDDQLSGRRTQVYYNAKDQKQIVVHRGTQGIQDLFTDVNLAFGRLSKTNRYKHAKKIAEEAQKKRPLFETTQLGHSLGGALARNVASKKDNIITFNTAVAPNEMFKKHKKSQTNYRTQFDLVSALSPLILPNTKSFAGFGHSTSELQKKHSPAITFGSEKNMSQSIAYH